MTFNIIYLIPPVCQYLNLGNSKNFGPSDRQLHPNLSKERTVRTGPWPLKNNQFSKIHKKRTYSRTDIMSKNHRNTWLNLDLKPRSCCQLIQSLNWYYPDNRTRLLLLELSPKTISFKCKFTKGETVFEEWEVTGNSRCLELEGIVRGKRRRKIIQNEKCDEMNLNFDSLKDTPWGRCTIS